MMSKDAALEFLRQLEFKLRQSDVCYKDYQKNAGAFLYAKILMRINEDLIHHISSYGHLLPDHFQEKLICLMMHLEVWRERWEEAAALSEFKLNDKFAFQNDVNFPRSDVADILQYLKTLSK